MGGDARAPLLVLSVPTRRGGRWLVRLIASGVNGNGVLLPRRLLDQVARASRYVPVRCAWQAGALTHAPLAEAEHPGTRVGRVEASWTTDAAVLGVVRLDDDAERLREALLKMHQAGMLRRLLGLSIASHAQRDYPGGRPTIVHVSRIFAYDIVAEPADRDARFLRPLGPHDDTPDHPGGRA